MALPASPPRYDSWGEILAPIIAGERGWRVYALQCGVNAHPDGIWGEQTDRQVRAYQRSRDLTPDGIAGPATQGQILQEAGTAADRIAGLPKGVSWGFAVGEGAGVLAATNWFTPEGGRPGCDCGPEQRRRYGPPFNPAELAFSFNPHQALRHCAEQLRARQTEYMRRSSKLRDRPKLALEVAVLAHNAPFMAEQIVRNGRLSTPDALATWTRKPGGGHYTHREWRYHYPATILRFVA